MRITNFEQSNLASYAQSGEGLPLVFLHGFCEDSTVWDNFILKFHNRYIIRIDLPGFGKSDAIASSSIVRYSDAVYAVLSDYNIQKCLLIGHSMGGYVALEFAKKHPELLQGICLFHSHPYADSETKKAARNKSIEFIQNNGPIHYVKQLIPALFPPKYGNRNHMALAKLTFTASQLKSENIIAALESMRDRSDNQDTLKQMQCPALFIIGREDNVVPDYLEDIALLTIASIHVLDGVAHMGMIESPDKCQKIIKQFLEFIE